MPSSASPFATASTIWAGPFCVFIFAFTASPTPSFSNARRTWAPAALSGTEATDCAFRSVALSASGRADVGLLRPRPDRDAEPHARHVEGRPRRATGARRIVPEHLPRNDGEVEWATGRREADQLGGGAEADDELVAGGALELRSEVPHRPGDAAAGEDLELGSPQAAGRRQDKRHAQERAGHAARKSVHAALPQASALTRRLDLSRKPERCSMSLEADQRTHLRRRLAQLAPRRRDRAGR